MAEWYHTATETEGTAELRGIEPLPSRHWPGQDGGRAVDPSNHRKKVLLCVGFPITSRPYLVYPGYMRVYVHLHLVWVSIASGLWLRRPVIWSGFWA